MQMYKRPNIEYRSTPDVYSICKLLSLSWFTCLAHSKEVHYKIIHQIRKDFTVISRYLNKIFVTRHAKRYELGGRRHFEKIRLKVNVASRKNSTPKRVSKRSLTSHKTGSKAFFMLRFSANRLSNILYDIKCSLLNVRMLKLGRESSTQFSL